MSVSILNDLYQYLESGQRAAHAFLRSQRHHIVEVDVDAEQPYYQNINTEADRIEKEKWFLTANTSKN